MNEWGVTADNLEQKEQAWLAQYGDEIFYPYACQLMASTLDPYNPDRWTEKDSCYIMFPQEGKTSREQIEEIARKALHETGDGDVGAQYIDDLICNPILWYRPWIDGLYQADGPLWCAFFFTWDDAYSYYAQRASVYLTEDGEVVLAELELGGNG